MHKNSFATEKKLQDVKTILAPRHLDRVKKIKSLSESLGIKTQILNNEDEILNDVEIIILNFMGCYKIIINTQKVFLRVNLL